MKTIKSSKDITTLEVGDEVVFGNFSYTVKMLEGRYYLCNAANYTNDRIIKDLRINVPSFNKKLGIKCEYDQEYSACNAFPEYYSLEALTAVVSALFKEYEKQNELPKTWEEFCERNPIKRGECYISPCCNIIDAQRIGRSRNADEDRSSCISAQEAEAVLALMQLRQLRKAYVKDWKPDWACDSTKFCIIVDTDRIRVTDHYFCRRSLSFPTQKLAEQFLTNFKDLLEIAKPLL